MRHDAEVTPVKRDQIALREWLILTIFLLVLTIGFSAFAVFQRLDQSFYDRLLQTQSRPARDDIIIVAIDDYSLAELGKWPWSRNTHAELLNRLQAAKPIAIGIDVIFTEEENGEADAHFTQAIKDAGNVVFPLTSVEAGKGLQAAAPLASYAKAVKSWGHNHLELDNDGVARSVFLREGTLGKWWPHFALALHDIGRGIQRDIGTQKTFAGTRTVNQPITIKNGVWHRDFQMHIPYYGGSGQFSSIPYVAVLRGEVMPEVFHDKYVLIGATAQGMADAFPTPVTSNEGTVSGVEINANILASLLDGRSIMKASTTQNTLVNVFVVVLALISFLFSSPRAALFSTFGLMLAFVLSSVLLLKYGVWISPATAIIVLVIAYPLWSWRRLEASIQFLGEEFILLDQEPNLLPEFDPELRPIDQQEQKTRHIQDKLERHFSSMRAAARRVRDLRQFVSDSLNSLPDVSLVTSVDGDVLLANPPAHAYFKSIGIPRIIDALVPYLFANMTPPHTVYADQKANFSWWHLLDLQQSELLLKGVEVVDSKARNLIIKSAPCYSAQKVLVGWIVGIVDISEIRQAEKQRDQTLHFVSNDMRAPQASILALIEFQKDPKTSIAHEDFLDRIERAAQTTLALADNFVHLAQAESNAYLLTNLDFQELLREATEEMSGVAQRKGIQIETTVPEDYYPVRVDHKLMAQALTELLSNAIKNSSSNTTVTCTLDFESENLSDYVVCTIQHQGDGDKLHERDDFPKESLEFKHNNIAENLISNSVDLGMLFVKTVIDKHFAELKVHNVPSTGTCFTIKIAAQMR